MPLLMGTIQAKADGDSNIPLLSAQVLDTLIAPALQGSIQSTIMKVTVTAYSSTPDQTDDTPFIAASGRHVYDGMIASNFLKFGTKVKIPALFGDKVFTVEDRMAKRYFHRIDVWFSTRLAADRFGIQEVEVVIL